MSTHKCYTHKVFENYDIILSNGSYQQKELELSENLLILKKRSSTQVFIFRKPLENKIKISTFKKKKILFALSWNKNRDNLFDRHV